jgi:tetratricopeptide (TPR) repeat protein
MQVGLCFSCDDGTFMSVLRLCLAICLIAPVAANCVPLLADAQVSVETARDGALRRAAELEERGQFAQAEQIYLAQEKHFPRNAEILFHLGTLRMRQNDWPKAIEYLEGCKALEPRNTDVLFYLAQAQYLNGELVPAQQTILSAARLAPKEAALLQKAGEYLCEGNDCGPGLDDLLKARKLDPALENIDMDLGMAYYKLFKQEEAQPILEAVFRKDPNNLVAALILGEIAAYQGNWEKARGLYEYVLMRKPRNASALKDLGTALVALGKDEEALSPLHEALEIDPSLSDVHYQLGRALRNLGRAEDSLHEMELYQLIRDRAHIAQALVSPDKASQNEHWRECEKLLKEKGESAAIVYVNSIAAETHSQLNAYYMVGMIYSAQQRNEDAIRVLNKAAQVSPNGADIVAFLGRVYLRAHNYEQSELDLKRALVMSPQNQIALVGMGELEYEKGQWTEAARYFDESRTQEVSALLLMCNAYARAGNRDKAHEAAEMVRAFAHGDTRSLEELNSTGCADDAVEPQPSAHPTKVE